jgi:hypothetical protein
MATPVDSPPGGHRARVVESESAHRGRSPPAGPTRRTYDCSPIDEIRHVARPLDARPARRALTTRSKLSLTRALSQPILVATRNNRADITIVIIIIMNNVNNGKFLLLAE